MIAGDLLPRGNTVRHRRNDRARPGVPGGGWAGRRLLRFALAASSSASCRSPSAFSPSARPFLNSFCAWTERTRELGQLRPAEDDQHDQQDDDEFRSTETEHARTFHRPAASDQGSRRSPQAQRDRGGEQSRCRRGPRDLERHGPAADDERFDARGLPVGHLFLYLLLRCRPAGRIGNSSRSTPSSTPGGDDARRCSNRRPRSRLVFADAARTGRACARPSRDRDRRASHARVEHRESLAIRVRRPRPARVPTIGVLRDEPEQSIALAADEHTRARLLERRGQVHRVVGAVEAAFVRERPAAETAR